MIISASALKGNISKLKTRVLEIDKDDTLICAALGELYGLVERLNQLDVGVLTKKEILIAQEFANRFITKQNKNDLNSERLNNDSLLKDIFMATYIIKVAYQNIVEPVHRTEAELAALSEDINNLIKQKEEYKSLLKKAEALSNLEKSIDKAEDTIVKISEINEEVEDYKEKISELAEYAKSGLIEISADQAESSKIISGIKATKQRADDQIEENLKSEKEIQKKFSDLTVYEQVMKESFSNQQAEIQKIIDDANRASMAGSFKTRVTEITSTLRWLDTITYLVLLSICILLVFFFTVSYSDKGFSITEFLSRIPITLPLIWLAWLTSRKSAYLSRIREDYAYKYSSAMAFEGYKKQVQEISGDLLGKLLEIAVNNLGDNPTRLYNDKVKHTPFDVDTLSDLIKSLPKDKIEELFKLVSNSKKQ